MDIISKFLNNEPYLNSIIYTLRDKKRYYVDSPTLKERRSDLLSRYLVGDLSLLPGIFIANEPGDFYNPEDL